MECLRRPGAAGGNHSPQTPSKPSVSAPVETLFQPERIRTAPSTSGVLFSFFNKFHSAPTPIAKVPRRMRGGVRGGEKEALLQKGFLLPSPVLKSLQTSQLLAGGAGGTDIGHGLDLNLTARVGERKLGTVLQRAVHADKAADKAFGRETFRLFGAGDARDHARRRARWTRPPRR